MSLIITVFEVIAAIALVGFGIQLSAAAAVLTLHGIFKIICRFAERR